MLATLVGSRICHDLISPIGAVQNGVELLELSRSLDGPELELIAESVRSASTRARFFRIAYGGASVQMLGRGEVAGVIDDFNRTGRLKVDWGIETPQSRALVRLSFLSLQCCESAMPLGGTVQITAQEDRWQLVADSARLQMDPHLWEDLMLMPDLENLQPAHVQFALLPMAANGMGRQVEVIRRDTGITLSF